MRFERRLNIDALEQAILRIERTIEQQHPSTRNLFRESGAPKPLALSARRQHMECIDIFINLYTRFS